MRRAARKDANHGAIADALQRLGCSVLDLSRLGDGAPDMLVGLLGRTVLLEVKAPKGTVQGHQEAFIAAWRGEAYIVRSVDEALTAIFRK